jgi:hypothetical protein
MLSTLQWYARTIGVALDVDLPRIWKKAKKLPSFRRALRDFRSRCSWPIEIEPKLGDDEECAGTLHEYFWQDYWVVRRILQLAPRRVVDVGSRIDGFVANVSCHRQIDVIDRRDLVSEIPGVKFHRIDLLELPESWVGTADCVTCLHTIEHFGLGRYGDNLDPEAWRQGLKQLALLLESGGRLILSTPIGRERVKFNAHRIFHPRTIVDGAADAGLSLERFAYLDGSRLGNGPVVVSEAMEADMANLSRAKYSLGIFEFIASA